MKTIIQRIQEAGILSIAEKKIADYFEQGYPASITGNIGHVSSQAGVSPASVTRFIHRLGYSGFAELRIEAEESLKNRLVSPIERYHTSKDNIKDKYSIQEHMEVCVKNITETAHRINESDFNDAVKLIVGAKKIYVAGGASAFALAEYFAIFARYMRDNVCLLSPDISTLAHKLVDVKEGDVLLAIAHYRVSSVTVNIAKYFAEHQNKVILIADRAANPASIYADITIPVCSGGTPMFNSRVVTLAVLEALFNAMIPYLESDIKKRFDIMENIFKDYDVYSK